LLKSTPNNKPSNFLYGHKLQTFLNVSYQKQNFSEYVPKYNSFKLITYSLNIVVSMYVYIITGYSQSIENTLANFLLSVTLGKEVSANCTSATTSLLRTFCRALDKEKPSSRRQVTVTEPLSSACWTNTRQRRLQCASLPVPLSSAPRGTRQSLSLCRVTAGLAHNKWSTNGSLCQSLCRVSEP
jgi:hypothetical protein